MLTRDDVNVLIEALEAWEYKDIGGEVLGSMLVAMLGSGADPIAKEKMRQQQDEDRERYKQERQARKERAIGIKARLLEMRDRIDADALISGALK